MKKLHIIHSIIIFLSLCFFFNPKIEIGHQTTRSIASTSTIKEDLQEILDFKFIGNNKNPKEVFAKIEQVYGATKEPNVHIQVFLKDATNNLPADLSYRIVPKIVNEQYVLEVQYNQKGLSDFAATVELSTFIRNFSKGHYKSKFHFFELYYNASNGDATSMHIMAEIKREAFVNRAYIQSEMPGVEKVVESELYNIKKMKEKYANLEKVQKTQIRLNRQKRLSQFSFDQKNLAPTFKDLVAKNDRIGTANLLEKILPWEIMQPLEKKMFKDHLTYMKNPLPIEQRILLYRGIDKNTIFLDASNQKGTKVFDAIYSSQIFLLSHFLDSKKLTSKEFENFHQTPFLLDFPSKKSNKYQRATPITTYFQSHAIDSFNSLFLSTTTDMKIAARFGRDRLAMLAIDPRLSYTNFASGLKSEKEFLIPFFIFPDEILSTIQYSYDLLHMNLGDKTDKEVHRKLLEAYYRKFDKSMSQLEADRLFFKLKNNTKEFDNLNLNPSKSLMGPGLDKTMRTFVKSEAQLSKTPLTPAPRSCLELMTIFNAL